HHRAQGRRGKPARERGTAAARPRCGRPCGVGSRPGRQDPGLAGTLPAARHRSRRRDHARAIRLAPAAGRAGAAARGGTEGDRERFAVAGPSVFLSPQFALALAMTLHELCTNAAKYGALSTPGGAVKLIWQVAGSPPRLTMQWAEAGGPSVKPPKKTGFGSRL